MARTRKAEPVWEWTFDLAKWPHGTFFGRRWLEFHHGYIVQPPNGCIYSWTCVWATIAWAFDKVLSGIKKAPFRLLKAVMQQRAAKRPKPVLSPGRTSHATFVAPPKVAIRSYERQRAKVERQTPFILRFIGRYILHPVFLGRYSPFRLLGRGLLVVLIPVDRFMRRNEDAVFPVMITVGVLALIVIAFINEPIITAIVLGTIFTLIVLLVLLRLFLDSEFGRVVIGMATATKDRLCPGTKLIDTRSGPSTSAA